jgi:hypothetical protein
MSSKGLDRASTSYWKRQYFQKNPFKTFDFVFIDVELSGEGKAVWHRCQWSDRDHLQLSDSYIPPIWIQNSCLSICFLSKSAIPWCGWLTCIRGKDLFEANIWNKYSKIKAAETHFQNVTLNICSKFFTRGRSRNSASDVFLNHAAMKHTTGGNGRERFDW